MLTVRKDSARSRAEFLFERQLNEDDLAGKQAHDSEQPTKVPTDWLRQKVFFSGITTPLPVLIGISLGGGFALGYLLSLIVSPYVIPLFIVAGMYLPWSYLDGLAQKRAAGFSGDYPTVLLATASSIKVGLTPVLALERSIRLLPKESAMRGEVERLIGALRNGESKEKALNRFALDIALPDLPLFRSAFLLVMENGGKFAPTLHRLATVSKDRGVLISSARVSTATMRMTANILLCIAPVLVLILSARMENYWTLFREHPVANGVASVGIVIISMSYLVLRKMSAFKP